MNMKTRQLLICALGQDRYADLPKAEPGGMTRAEVADAVSELRAAIEASPDGLRAGDVVPASAPDRNKLARDVMKLLLAEEMRNPSDDRHAIDIAVDAYWTADMMVAVSQRPIPTPEVLLAKTGKPT